MTALDAWDWMTLVFALACGLVAGFFFAFSVCVMKSLGALPPALGIAAMQRINVVVINPWFMTPFLGMAVACVPALAASPLRWHDARAAYWLAGGLCYLVGTFGVTMLRNVPRNDALAAVDPGSPEGAELWLTYLSSWTHWNHVRTLAALAAALAFSLALCV